MSKTAVIYCSRTGFSARYAKWIAKALHADLYRYKTIEREKLAQKINQAFDSSEGSGLCYGFYAPGSAPGLAAGMGYEFYG